MLWWPVAATVSAGTFVLSLGALLVAPGVSSLCAGTQADCDSFALGARSLVVGSGAFLTASLVAGLYAALLNLTQRAKAPDDARPLVSVHARRRP